ncbi:hypothetical protein QFC22_005979 [Naganishia vaughanmartiniae]|uniref:Uncharacterized protein n=1 Tax=Naganishia vaughanmartiniae TaxID=1424756 RepID=A0ACC2WR70_9TREE|nr:hypothetical protein QFC22_005979 [Naganishia vaughanmartiniae]
MAESIIGKRIALKSNSEIRYIGTLYAIDHQSSAISLVDVLSLGTEDRITPGGFVPPANTVYPYVVFRASDVRDIAVIGDPSQGPQAPASLPLDPAIVSQGRPAAPVQQSSPFQSRQQAAPPPPPQQQPISSPNPAPAGPSSMMPPVAPSVATAHSTTLARLHPDSHKIEQHRQPSSAAPSRQPYGPVGIPFEQLATQTDTHGSTRGSNHPHSHNPVQRHPAGGPARGGPHRAPRGGRAPGAFSHAAQSEDLAQDFDFEGINKRFEESRSGEAPQAPVEDNATKGETQQETRQPSSALPSRQPNGPVGIPFEQLAAQIDTHGSTRGSNHPHSHNPMQRHPAGGPARGGPHRAPRGGRAPGAFSHAAQSEDLTQEFDFEGMNQRFEELRSGEAPQAPVEDNATKGEIQHETATSPKLEAEEKPSVPAYNKSSSFFDSVSSNIQNPSSTNNRGRGGGGGGRGSGRPRNFDQHTGIPQSHPQSGFPPAAARGPPRPAQGREESGLPPRPRGGGGAGGRNNNRRRDEGALNAATFGDDGATQGGEAGTRGGRMGGRGRYAGNGRPAAAAE